MTSSPYSRRTYRQPRIRWLRVAGLLLVIATIAGVLGSGLPASSPSTSTAAAPTDAPRREHRRAPSPPPAALGVADGAVPDGTTVVADGIPGIANLDPELLGALHEAATEASADGVELLVDSGWRSAAYQERLLRDAVTEYGSEAEAARWVATPETSAHVSGDAVDIGPAEAAGWLSAHGAAYGLCQTYANEPWHFELRTEAVDQGCPAMYADPTHDPRMQT